jgi:hypothetical protein
MHVVYVRMIQNGGIQSRSGLGFTDWENATDVS